MYSVGDVIMTKKKHACGGWEWEILRTGADYKLRCRTCGRVIMLPYEDFTHCVKKVLESGEKNG